MTQARSYISGGVRAEFSELNEELIHQTHHESVVERLVFGESKLGYLTAGTEEQVYQFSVEATDGQRKVPNLSLQLSSIEGKSTFCVASESDSLGKGRQSCKWFDDFSGNLYLGGEDGLPAGNYTVWVYKSLAADDSFPEFTFNLVLLAQENYAPMTLGLKQNYVDLTKPRLMKLKYFSKQDASKPESLNIVLNSEDKEAVLEITTNPKFLFNPNTTTEGEFYRKIQAPQFVLAISAAELTIGCYYKTEVPSVH